MTTNQVLQQLAAFADGVPVLSIYLDTDLSAKSKEAVRLMLRDRLHSLGEMPAMLVQRVNDYLDYEFDWRSRGLAIFANAQGWWQVVSLPVAPPTQAYWAAQPYLRTLSDVVDRFGAYLVALLDRESLRVFSVRMGEIQAQTEVLGEELKRHKQGGWSAQVYQRHEDNLAMQNLKQAAEALEAFSEHTGVRRLVLGGSPDVLTQFHDVLPRRISDQIIGEFAADVSASAHKALQLSLDVVYQADLTQEAQLVEQAITAANKGEQGVIGMADTIYALYQGRARIVLVAESFHASAYVCEHCGSVSVEPITECPLCGYSDIKRYQDVANLAVHKAVETGATLNIVRDNAALNAAGGMAAILRY